MAIPQAVLLIDQNYILQYSHLNRSVEFSYIKASILDAQAVRLQQILGTDLYEKILTETADSTIAGAYITLKDSYIKPSLLYWTLWDALPHLKVKIDNGGIVERTSEYTTQIGTTEIDRIREDYKAKAQFMDRRMIDYLCNNSSSFPEWSTNESNQLQATKRTGILNFGVVSRTNNRDRFLEDSYWRSLLT